MFDPVFDFNNGDFIFGDGDVGFNSDGDMMMRMGDGMAMNMETGEMHLTSGWDYYGDDDD